MFHQTGFEKNFSCINLFYSSLEKYDFSGYCYYLVVHVYNYRSSCPALFCKKSVLRNLAKLTGKHLCQSLFLNKVAGLRQCIYVDFSFVIWTLLLFFCVCVFIPFHRRGFSWLKQNNKCNARDQASDVMMRKLLCVKYFRRHVIENHSRDLQASNCARVSIKLGRAMWSKRQLLNFLKTNRKSTKHSYLPPH